MSINLSQVHLPPQELTERTLYHAYGVEQNLLYNASDDGINRQIQDFTLISGLATPMLSGTFISITDGGAGMNRYAKPCNNVNDKVYGFSIVTNDMNAKYTNFDLRESYIGGALFNVITSARDIAWICNDTSWAGGSNLYIDIANSTAYKKAFLTTVATNNIPLNAVAKNSSGSAYTRTIPIDTVTGNYKVDGTPTAFNFVILDFNI